MKTIFTLILLLILVGCKSIENVATPTINIRSIQPTLQSTTSFPSQHIPAYIATPVVANIDTIIDLKNIIYQIYPHPCISMNYAQNPTTDINHASALFITEVNILQDTQRYWISEIAKSVNGMRMAWVACDNPNYCEDSLYVLDEKIKRHIKLIGKVDVLLGQYRKLHG